MAWTAELPVRAVVAAIEDAPASGSSSTPAPLPRDASTSRERVPAHGPDFPGDTWLGADAELIRITPRLVLSSATPPWCRAGDPQRSG